MFGGILDVRKRFSITIAYFKSGLPISRQSVSQRTFALLSLTGTRCPSDKLAQVDVPVPLNRDGLVCLLRLNASHRSASRITRTSPRLINT